VHRVVEVSLSDNADLDNAVVANGAVIAAYATRVDRTEIPFWNLLFNNVVLRLVGSDDFPEEAKRQAARDLTAAAVSWSPSRSDPALEKGAAVRCGRRPLSVPGRTQMRPSFCTVSRSSTSSATEASMRAREKSSISRPWTISYLPSFAVTGKDEMRPSGTP
jgi:hypothetical protein